MLFLQLGTASVVGLPLHLPPAVVADNLEAFMKESVAHLWDDVNAIDTVLAEVSAEFDGLDALRPVMRGVLEKARHELSLLHEWLSGKEAVENTVPSNESMELARTYFSKGVELYERM